MKNLRNYIMFGLLAIFFSWYGLSWAYESLYREPRQRLGTKIAQFKQGIEGGKKSIASMQQVVSQNQMLYFRSLPRIPNDARSLYSFWLLELIKFCELKDGDAYPDNPTRAPMGGYNYRFHVRGTGSLDQVNRFLFEFYFAPFLHKITSMSIAAQEGKEEVAISLTIDALAIPPKFPQDQYPLTNQLPTGHYRRLLATDLGTYHVIAERNLLRAARGGVDRADYAYLTGINVIGDVPEIWLTIRTDGSVVKAKKGESVRIGSFHATVAGIFETDVVFDRGGTRWLMTVGDCVNQAFALPAEAIYSF